MAIVDDAGGPLATGTVGHIGLKRSAEGYYSLGYWNNPDMPKGELRGDWLMSGDLGRQDEDGYFWFEGRADDVINSAGYRIGPFEVESAILHHPAVAEAAVVGWPDRLRGEIVAAHVVLKPGEAVRDGLEDEIVDTVKRVLGKHQQPRRIIFVDSLPKTETGKIQRFRLRERG
jgi:acetyl-CoA synthetase